MTNIGIDLGKKRSDICIINDAGEVERRERVKTSDLPAWLQAQPQSRIVMETCAESRAIHEAGLQAGHRVIVVPGYVTRSLGIGRRGIKNDARDAEVLGRAAYRNEPLPEVHLRGPDTTEASKLLNARRSYKDRRTELINQIKAALRSKLRETPPSSSPSFVEQVRRQYAAIEREVPLPVELMLESLQENEAKIARLDEALDEMREREEVRLLRSIPGIGPIASVALWCAIDDPHRFKNLHEVGSYLGLVPGEHSTGGKIRRTGLIMAGPAGLRPVLVQCAWTYFRCRKEEPLGKWAHRLAKRRGKKVAVCALARKLAVIAWAILKTGRPYNALRAAAELPEETSVEDQLVHALRS